MAPIAVRLLQRPGSTPHPQQADRARFVALLAAAATILLSVPGIKAQEAFYQQLGSVSTSIAYGTRTVLALITALPYIPLFIAFYLIANPDSRLIATYAEISSDSPPEPNV